MLNWESHGGQSHNCSPLRQSNSHKQSFMETLWMFRGGWCYNHTQRWKCAPPQAIQDVAFHHLLSNRSSAVNGCRQNESPNSWYKHHNNPQVIQTTPVHQLTSGEDKSIIHNNASYSEIVYLLLSLTSKSSHILFRAVLNCFVL